MIFGYIRVSTAEQNVSRQVEALKDFDSNLKNENLYIDKASGKDFERTQYQEMKKVLRKGDILIIKELDRLGRNKEMMKEEMLELKNRGVQLKILNIPTTLIDLPPNQEWIIDMVNNVLIEVLAAIAQEERNTSRRRQREGIEIAKKEGKYPGRKIGTTAVALKAFEKIYHQVQDKKISVSQATVLLGYKSRSSYYNLQKQYEDANGLA